MARTGGWLLMTGVLTALGGGCGDVANMGPGRDEKVVAVWQRLYRSTGQVQDEYTFRPDGTFAFDERKGGARNEDHVTGTYIADGTTVTERRQRVLERSHLP